MNIAVASGKGGTGKTTLATNLTMLLQESLGNVRYLDCDVEEPNGHLFLKPTIVKTYTASIPVPVIDESTCTACGECVRFCEFKALIRLGSVAMVFPELCHGCGGCTLICPQQAITEQPRVIGVVETGTSGSTAFVHGRLNIGEAMSPPLIREVLKHASNDFINIIDAPPGTSCPVIASVRNVDFVVLITEPTPFGLNDLGLAVSMIRTLGIPHGVVINRAEADNADADDFCRSHDVAIVGMIPDDRRIAEHYSRGDMLVTSLPDIHEKFQQIWNAIIRRVES
ncbi:MAG: ATP-binding protein [Chitinivibrionales bacterium]|nr:ATP-binding protein [Chitinivibrionales bacterium]